MNIRKALRANRDARLQAMVHLRDYKDDLRNIIIERMTPGEVTAKKIAAYSGARGTMCAFQVPRWPNEPKPHLLLMLRGLIKSSERVLRSLAPESTDGFSKIDQTNAEPLFLLQCQCALESLKIRALECVPDLEIEAEGLKIARRRFLELFAFGLDPDRLGENIDSRFIRAVTRCSVRALSKLCLVRSNKQERLELSESKICNKEIDAALKHWREQVLPRISQVCSLEVGFSCDSLIINANSQLTQIKR